MVLLWTKNNFRMIFHKTEETLVSQKREVNKMWQKCICNNIGDLGIIIPMLYSLCYTDYQLFKLYCTIITQSIGIRALSMKMVPKRWTLMPTLIQPGRPIMSFIMFPNVVFISAVVFAFLTKQEIKLFPCVYVVSYFLLLLLV